MNAPEIEQATAYILEMFPSTDVTSRGMVTLWGKEFAHIELQDAKDAIDAHRIESLYASIKIAEFRKHVRVIIGRRLSEQRRTARDDTPVPEQYCGMFITDGKKEVPIMIVQPIRRHMTPEEIRQTAENMIMLHERVYGSQAGVEWQIVDDPDGRIFFKIAWGIFDAERAADEQAATLDEIRLQQENENV